MKEFFDKNNESEKYSEKATLYFDLVEKTEDQLLKKFYKNVGIGYLYKLCRMKGIPPVVSPAAPYREDGNYIGVSAGIPDVDEYFGVDSMMIYELNEDDSLYGFVNWDKEGNRVETLMKHA